MSLVQSVRFHKNIYLLIKLFNSHRSFSSYNFTRKLSLQSFIRSSLFSKVHFKGSELLYCRQAHTTKGWKFMAKPRVLENDEEELDPADVPCEEGTGAVPHSDLTSLLNKCVSVEDQINILDSTLSLTEEDRRNRKEFCDDLTSVLKPYLAPFKLHQFGSGTNGLGFKGCDIDICISFQHNDDDNPVEHLKIEPPTLQQVENGEIDKADVSRLYPRLLLRFIRRVIRKNCVGVKEPILLIKGRCPIIRFYNEKYDLFCDFSYENQFSVRNTKLLRFVTHLDSRIGPLLKTLRYWGKHAKFIGDVDMFNSYAFSLVVLYFLQNTTPPVLPPLNFIISAADYLKGHDKDICDEMLHESLKSIPPSLNTQTTEELLREFFFFYLCCDFSHVLVPLTSFSVLKQDFSPGESLNDDTFEFSTISLQDPFRQSFNTTGCINYKYSKKFLARILSCCKLYKQPHLFSPNVNENWGLSLLLNTSSHTDKQLTANKKEEFELSINSSKSDILDNEKLYCEASRCIKTIFEKALLFECTDSSLQRKLSSSDHPYKQILNVRCKVEYNTWSNRHLTRRKLFSDLTPPDDSLILEHMISESLVKEKQSQNAAFKFYCACYGLIKNNRPILKVRLNFETEKISPVLSIFFPNYLQEMLNKLL